MDNDNDIWWLYPNNGDSMKTNDFLESSSGVGGLKDIACHFVVTELMRLWTLTLKVCLSRCPSGFFIISFAIQQIPLSDDYFLSISHVPNPVRGPGMCQGAHILPIKEGKNDL